LNSKERNDIKCLLLQFEIYLKKCIAHSSYGQLNMDAAQKLRSGKSWKKLYVLKKRVKIGSELAAFGQQLVWRD
jgi:hypothetical protein